jgi:hypothetical protein
LISIKGEEEELEKKKAGKVQVSILLLLLLLLLLIFFLLPDVFINCMQWKQHELNKLNFVRLSIFIKGFGHIMELGFSPAKEKSKQNLMINLISDSKHGFTYPFFALFIFNINILHKKI